VDGDEITSLILDEAVLNRDSFNVIVGETPSISNLSLVGLEFSDGDAAELYDLLKIEKLDSATVDQTPFNLDAKDFNTFAAMEDKSLTVIFADDFNRDGTVNLPDFFWGNSWPSLVSPAPETT
jgi:hypothetical protein